jgi:dipeptidyl aminopeptidase/acylaminoacyl peptidase
VKVLLMRSRFREVVVAALVAAPVVALTTGDVSASAGTTAPAGGYRIVLGSDRDGETRPYSVRPDGKGLRPILARGRMLAPAALSRDGATIAYYSDREEAIYVSRADGVGFHRVVRGAVGGGIAFSPDAKRLTFIFGNPRRIAVIGTDGRARRNMTLGRDDESPSWSPDGKAFAFLAQGAQQDAAILVQRFRGSPRVLVRNEEGLGGPTWSPDGRWIAYESYGDRNRSGIYVIQPNGKRRHRLVRGLVWSTTWSRDGKRLTYGFGSPADIATVGVDGRGRKRLGLRLPSYVGALDWSPDGRLLAFESPWEPKGKIWVVGADGRGRRRVATVGGNDLVGWTRLAPRLAPARPLLPSERVLGAGTLITRRPVKGLSGRATGGGARGRIGSRLRPHRGVAAGRQVDPTLQQAGTVP